MRRKDIAMDGSNPTLLDAYGGFEISMLPYYSGGVGAGWLEKGGIKVPLPTYTAHSNTRSRIPRSICTSNAGFVFDFGVYRPSATLCAMSGADLPTAEFRLRQLLRHVGC